MQGMHRDTGKLISDKKHLRQSIGIILTTPIGSRVMRPGFGSELPSLVAAPMTANTDLRIYAAVLDALNRWEPRLITENVQIVNRTADGELELKLTGQYYGEQIEIDGIRINGTSST